MVNCVRASEVHIFGGGGDCGVPGVTEKKYNSILLVIVPGFITLTLLGLLGEEYKLPSMSWQNLKIRLEFNQPDLQWGRGTLVTRIQRPNREADHSSVGTVTPKDRWNQTSTPNISTSLDA